MGNATGAASRDAIQVRPGESGRLIIVVPYIQELLGHSTPAMLRRYTATYDAEKAAQAHASFSPADRLNGRLRSQRSSLAGGPSKARSHPGLTPVSPRILNLRP